MKYIKTFEKVTEQSGGNIGEFQSDEILFENNKIRLFYQSPNYEFCLIYKLNGVAMRILSAIPGIAELIRDGAEIELSDEKIKNIKIRKKDIKEEIRSLTLNDEKIKNIKRFRTGYIKRFLDDSINKNIPDEEYINLNSKYYPIILDAIKKSKKVGDLIDIFKIIYTELTEDAKYLYKVNKYNI
jgi:hypothetical protein